MPDPIVWCEDCQKMLKHMEVQETRTRICSGCGLESRFPAGHKTASAARDQKRQGRKESYMKRLERLDEKVVADIKKRKADGQCTANIAKALGLSYGAVYRVVGGASKYKKKGARNVGASKENLPAAESTGLRLRIDRIVDMRIDARLSDLDAHIDAAIERMFK